MIVAEKLVRHETPTRCRQTAHADEYVNMTIINFVLNFLHGDVHIYHKYWLAVHLTIEGYKEGSSESAVYSEIPGGCAGAWRGVTEGTGNTALI